jgi:voltage-gated potassium channel
MVKEEENNSEVVFGGLSLVILILSFYVLISLVITTFFSVTHEIQKILSQIDNFICIVFLIEFFYRFYKAPSKLQFLKWGWIDLISSIPFIDFLRVGRVLRLLRLLRILRAFKSIKHIVEHVYKDKSKGLLSTVGVIAFLMVLFSSVTILQVETAPNSNIKTAEDALWWSYTTLTTVGYGDKYPVTTEGRLIAAILMTTGVGLCGTFAGYIASILLAKNEK